MENIQLRVNHYRPDNYEILKNGGDIALALNFKELLYVVGAQCSKDDLPRNYNLLITDEAKRKLGEERADILKILVDVCNNVRTGLGKKLGR